MTLVAQCSSPRLASASERHDAVTLREQVRDIWRTCPLPVDLGQVFFGRPTGDGATLSDEDGDRVIAELRQ